MQKYYKTLLYFMVILNTVVLLGQIWPEGAPPFALVVNIGALALNIIFLIAMLLSKNK